ncbi:ATP-dependent Clp protease proteolytic subunit [Fusobacterium varium]|uniref:SDH family Clp fold serine proteinase n=1 Tax=Fusobacterium varium TaxID=856 RepID=UPI002FF0438F
MPNWGEILNTLRSEENPLDALRWKYLKVLHRYTGRNIITYYSSFLQNSSSSGQEINDNDKNAFMQAVHKLDKAKGLDLILHTPGGNIAAAESIVDYLKDIFGNDIRAIVPQISMSAGTMIALSCKEIIMGKQSNLGPIDPHFGGMSCSAIIEEFKRAHLDISKDPKYIPIWQAIISKYHPTFLGDCEKAILWSEEIVKKWLLENMLKDENEKENIANKIVEHFGSHEETKSHSRHIHMRECQEYGIKIKALESFPKKKIGDCKDFQDCVLTLHHTYMHTFTSSRAIKIVENHLSDAMITNEKI